MPRSFLVKKAEIRSIVFLDEDQKPKDFIAVGNIFMKGNDYVSLNCIALCYVQKSNTLVKKYPRGILA